MEEGREEEKENRRPCYCECVPIDLFECAYKKATELWLLCILHSQQTLSDSHSLPSPTPTFIHRQRTSSSLAP